MGEEYVSWVALLCSTEFPSYYTSASISSMDGQKLHPSQESRVFVDFRESSICVWNPHIISYFIRTSRRSSLHQNILLPINWSIFTPNYISTGCKLH